MAIYRGPGGAGDATVDATNNSTLALAAKNEAQASATSAASSATAAANSATAADTSADSASTSATNAAGSATTASTAATNASSSASSASSSATTAASEASDAADSAAAAAASASSASSSASTATTQASNASSSASSASTSASTATTKASEASTSATNAASSASTASTQATNASNSASAASTSETNAASSAADAADSADNASLASTSASNSATNAATSATNAANSSSSAATYASNADSSASSASTSASTATAAKDAALAALDSFDDRYLGSKTTAPSVDNDGNALVSGALYFNTTTNEMKVYDGTQWLNAYASLSGALLATNNLSDLNSVSTARTNLGLGTAATTASTDYATAAQGTKADTAHGWGNHASAGYLASSSYTASDVLSKLLTVDGTGSGLDADLLDGNSSAYFYQASNPSGYTTNTGTVTSVGGTGTVSGLTLSGTVTSSGNLTLGGAITGFLPTSGGTLSGTLSGTVGYFSSYINTSGPYYRNSAGAGYFNGQYPSVESSATSGAIYSIGGSYVPGTTNLGNMYGVGYGYSGNAGIAVTGLPSSIWGLYGASGGTSRWFLDSDNGRGFFNGALYSGGNLVLTSGTASVAGTAVASTSGTLIGFTGIPSWVKKVTIMLIGVSTNGSSIMQMRLGTSGGYVSSGYTGIGVSASSGGSWNISTNTSGLSVESGSNNQVAHTRIGQAVFSKQNGNTWIGTYQGHNTGINYATQGTTTVTLGGTLDRVCVTMVNGTDSFDLGSINIIYE